MSESTRKTREEEEREYQESMESLGREIRIAFGRDPDEEVPPLPKGFWREAKREVAPGTIIASVRAPRTKK